MKANNKKSNGLSYFQILLITLFVIVASTFLLYILTRPKFQDITIELGTKEIDVNSFVTAKMYRKKTTLLTDINEIDLEKVGVHDINFKYQDAVFTVKLNIIDTTAPTVKFKDMIAGSNYEFNVMDFISSVEDKSPYEVKSDFKIDSNLEFKDYKVKVDVIDKYNNRISSECTLTIVFAKDAIKHELGKKLEPSEFIYNPNDYDKITKEVLNQVDVKTLGSKTIKYEVDGVPYTLDVKVEDTTAPDLVVRDLTYYLGDKEKVNKDFVKSYKDASGDVELTYEGELNFEKVGVYELKISAKDASGNVNTKVAKLTVKADKVGPVFSGLTSLKVEKGASIDWNKGVKAVDSRDGTMEFTVDTSKVNLNNSGIYYAIYTAKDLSDNVTTKKRKVEVKHNAEDTDRLFKQYYDKHLAGKDPLAMTRYLRKNVAFENKTQTDDAVWEALTTNKSSCYGRALMLERALKLSGVPNELVCISPGQKTHCFNLAYYNNKWCYYDSTPGSHAILAGETAKRQSKGIHGRTWVSSRPADNTCDFIPGERYPNERH